MDDRGYSLRVAAVRDAARLLLQQRVGPVGSIGINWPRNFINRRPALKSRWTRKHDHQRALCEDPEVIKASFQLVYNIIAKYGIVQDDIYNFDQTGFASVLQVHHELSHLLIDKVDLLNCSQAIESGLLRLSRSMRLGGIFLRW